MTTSKEPRKETRQETSATFEFFSDSADNFMEYLRNYEMQVDRKPFYPYMICILAKMKSKVFMSPTIQTYLNKLLEDLAFHCQGILRMKLLGVLRTFSTKALEEKHGFQKFHALFLKLAIENRMYHLCLDVIEHPVVIVSDIPLENLLEFLYYSAIVLTVYERYDEAIEKLEMLTRLEKDDSNIKSDAEKKLTLLYCLIGKSRLAEQNSRKEDTYFHIVKRVDKPAFAITENEMKVLSEDGNLGLLMRLSHVSELCKLSQFANTHVRVPVDSIQGKSLGEIHTIKAINSMRRIYRYNPIDRCAEFVHPEVNVEKAISKAVRLYMELRYNKQKERRPRYNIDSKFSRLDFSAIMGGSYAYS